MLASELPDLTPIDFYPEGSPVDEMGLRQIDMAALSAERRRRAKVEWRGKHDLDFRKFCLTRAKRDPCFFFDQFVWTFDPKAMLTLPMALWPKQREYIQFLEEVIASGRDHVIEKTRDAGATYLNCGYSITKWLWRSGWKTTFCANKLELVDEIGNPDTIFEKIRGILRRLPTWMLPEGFTWTKHDRENRLINPANSNVITGEGGDNAGRGGRSSWYVVDEAAHVLRADSVNNATSANARCRAWCSSVNGNGNLFYRLRHGGSLRVFIFRWEDDPRKTPKWAAQKAADIGAVSFAQEYGRDYGASIEGLAIPMAWVEAARELYRRMPDAVGHYRTIKGVAGWDVGGGKAESVVVVRHGPVMEAPRHRTDPDGVDVAYWALDIARESNVGLLNYDAPGVGFTMGSILARAQTHDVEIRGVNTGVPPTERVWPDGRTSKEKFVSLKAELWWRAREAFNRSWLLLRHQQGDPDGIDYRADEVILLGDDDELARQLSTPKATRTERGLIMIETKPQLAARGIRSPDRADAAVLALHDDPTSTAWVGEL